MGGVRPKDIDIPVITEGKDTRLFQNFLMLRNYFKAIDSGDLFEAEKYADSMEKNMDTFSHLTLPGIYNELCYIGCVTNNVKRAKEFYEKGGKILENDNDVNGLRVKAYYAYCIDNNKFLASDYCKQALLVADKFPIRGYALMEEFLVRKLQDIIAANN